MTHSSIRYRLNCAAILLSTLTFFAYSSEQINEQITIVGEKPSYLTALDGVLPITHIDHQAVKKGGSVADIFSSAAEVNYNGQGGLLQTVSIRGLSRWRIQTLVEGVPIHTDRRAGNTAEFIAPGLIGNAYVLPGAASTQLGSGALGGGIDLQLLASADTTISTTFAPVQPYQSIQILGGEESERHNVYWGATTRHASNGEDGSNQALLNGFEQSVGWVRYQSSQSLVKEALFILSKSDNVNKASSDLPEQRQTIYPDSDHWLAKLNFSWLNAKVYAHHSALDTQIERPLVRSNTLQNSALGWGASINESFAIKHWKFNWQLALDARLKVKATEREESPQGTLVFDRTNLSGRQQATSLVIDTKRNWGKWQFAAGARFEHMYQSSTSEAPQREEDTNLSAFIGARKRWLKNWTTGLYLSTGYRVPTLTERFFFGSTPRGTTLGDPTLEAESARNLQANIEYQGHNFLFSVNAFRQTIDHYIERVTLNDTTQQYLNLGDARIDGASYRGSWTIFPSLNLNIQGQWLWGEDNNGNAINDISPHQHNAQLNWQSDSKTLWLNMTYRHAHGNPGSGEVATNSIAYFQAGYEQQLAPTITASVTINNLTDKNYLASADELAANAQGRDIAFNLSYMF